MIDAFASILGYILNIIYNIVGNYGLALIIFSVLLKVSTFNLSLSQRRTSKKSTALNQKSKELQERYKDNPEKYNQELIKLYKDNKVSPCSSCLSAIFQILLVLAVFAIVSKPLTHIKKVDSEKLEKYKTELALIKENENLESENTTENNEEKTDIVSETIEEEIIIDKEVLKGEKEELDEQKELENSEAEKQNVNENIIEENESQTATRSNLYEEIDIIKYFGAEDEEVNLNMNFLGIDLTAVPRESFSILIGENNSEEKTLAIKNLIIPILYIILSVTNLYFSNKEMEKMQEEQKALAKDEKIVRKKKHEEKLENEKELKFDSKDDNEDSEDMAQALTQANKNMIYLMPILIFSATMIAPLGLALYWLTSSVLLIVERHLINKIMEKDEQEDVKMIEGKKG